MKIIGEGLFLLGKIKVWKNPVYLLDMMGKNSENFRDLLAQQLNCVPDLPYFKKPNPETVLGRFKPTFRFERLLFQDPVDAEIFDHLKLGFGENGYYYDLHLNSCECDLEHWQKIMKKIEDKINLIEKVVENDLEDFVYKKEENVQNPVSEISNIDLTFDDSSGLVKKSFPQISKIITILEETPQLIISGSNNFIMPEFRFHIDSQMRIDEPFLYRRSRKYLENRRDFRLRKIHPKLNRWNINSRGVSLPQFSNFMNLFLGSFVSKTETLTDG
ncbi:MAG: hypothetical protein ACTSRK_10310 [Promethearchaeota archaeon]